MKHRGLFIAGTDTGVGKTWTTVRLLRHLRALGRDAVGMKPVECGGREDAAALRDASDGILSLDEINPIHTTEALAPAALTDPLSIDFDEIRARYGILAERHGTVLVEGAGGWLVPLDRDRTMADLAAVLGLPVLLVAANRLGVLNHVLLTLRAVETSGLVCRAIFLNDPGGIPDPSQRSNARVLRGILPALPVVDGDIGALGSLLYE